MSKSSKIKPPIVLFHGLFGSPLGLAEIADALRSAGYEVFVPAVPPFAGSESAWQAVLERDSADSRADVGKAYADYFRDYFSENHLKYPVPIGHSMGTLVVSNIIKYYPDIVNDKVILMSPISQSPNFFIAKISALSAFLPPKLTDWFTTHFLITPCDRRTFRSVIEQVHRCSLDQRPSRRNVLAATRFSASSTIAESLSQLAPTKCHFDLLLLAGEHDRLVPSAATRRATGTLNHLAGQPFACTATFLPDTGHLHNYEQPAATVAKILEFLQA